MINIIKYYYDLISRSARCYIIPLPILIYRYGLRPWTIYNLRLEAIIWFNWISWIRIKIRSKKIESKFNVEDWSLFCSLIKYSFTFIYGFYRYYYFNWFHTYTFIYFLLIITLDLLSTKPIMLFFIPANITLLFLIFLF